MELWHIWLIAGILLFIFEIFTPGFVLASFAIACVFSGLASLLGYNFKIQIFVFSIITLIVFFTIRPLLCKYFYRFDDPLKTNVDALIGKTARVLEKIQNADNAGRVKIEGEDWKARSESGEVIEEGELVVVKKIEGVTVIVNRKN